MNDGPTGSDKKRILILTTFYPPRNTIASQRPYAWAKTWSRAGHDVTVITTKKVPREGDTEQPLEGVKVIEVDVPLLSLIGRVYKQRVPPSAHEQAVGAERKFSLGHHLITGVLKPLRDRGVLALARFPDVSEAWVRPALQAAMELARFDLLISTGWPYTVHRVANALRVRGHANGWIIDWRDLWVDNPMYPGLPIFTLYERYLERMWHANANLITTVSEPLAAQLREITPTPVEVIMNGVDVEDMQRIDSESTREVPDLPRTITYTGTYYPGWRDAKPLFRALAELAHEGRITPRDFRITLMGHCPEMLPEAQAYGVSDFVQYLGYVQRDASIRHQRDADALLFLDLNSSASEGIMTGKIFEYLYWRKPIWSVGGVGTSGTGAYLTQPGSYEFMGDHERIKVAILDLLKAPKPPLVVERDVSFSRAKQATALIEVYERVRRYRSTISGARIV